MKSIMVWGASGQLLVIDEFVNQIGYKIEVVFDNNKIKCPLNDIPLCCGVDGFYNYFDKNQKANYAFVVAIGGANGFDRVNISNFLDKEGLTSINIIHPNAYVSKTAVIQLGAQIMASATVGAKAIVGKYTILNTGSVIDHECKLGKGVHVAPGATLTGLVEVGDYSFIGAGAVVLPRIKIGKNSIVGAGSVVTKDVPNNVICYGNPARNIKNKGVNNE